MMTFIQTGDEEGFTRSTRGDIGFKNETEDRVAFCEEGTGFWVLKGAVFCNVGGFFDNRASIEVAASSTNLDREGFTRSAGGDIRFEDAVEDEIAFWEEGTCIWVLEGAGFCNVGGFFNNRASIRAAASATNSSSKGNVAVGCNPSFYRMSCLLFLWRPRFWGCDNLVVLAIREKISLLTVDVKEHKEMEKARLEAVETSLCREVKELKQDKGI
nr:hypothetical protein [Tanacetum cinerariifolium]